MNLCKTLFIMGSMTMAVFPFPAMFHSSKKIHILAPKTVIGGMEAVVEYAGGGGEEGGRANQCATA